jgi:hypothetical protein
MLRKHLLTEPPSASGPQVGAKAMAAITTVWVTSEAAAAPIDQAFDQSRGPGGSCCVPALPGDQPLILALATPETIRTRSLQVEDPSVSCPQVLHVSLSPERGQTV